MSHSDPSWYRDLQVDIFKQKKFNDRLLQKIVLRSQKAEATASKPIRSRLAYVSLASLLVALTALFVIHRSGGFAHQPDMTVKQGGQAQAGGLEDLPDQKPNVPEPTDISSALPIGRIDISEVPADENFIPKSVQLSHDSEGSTSYLEGSAVSAENTERGFTLRTTYRTSDGVEFLFVQAAEPVPEEETLQWFLTSDAYGTEKKEQTEIQGHAVIYVDGEVRRVAHLITDKHLFTVMTNEGTVDDCMEILEQIELDGE
ncbi:hypothetical protein SAMN05216312_101304 [Cohnella sp. OV330]|uniref:hypothetical protein n=1 Tax=Cohnella sp. OV330 TaxID=1855288 RepID=UPI0008E049D2|nr:hypothetical protein [Cohnella sp. OV330]SFA75593.1 hypothetical protein SAMN05216312_101304 [Cohnella sp. OV330]